MTTDALSQLKEQLGLIERAFEEHVSTQARGEHLDGAQRDRDRRQLVDLVQQVEALGRSVDQTATRTLALAEEVRRERDGRTPLTQAIDELQRAQSALQGRISVLDELTRRYGAFTSTFEQADDRRQEQIARIDNQVKLLDLRLTRDLADLHQAGEAWMGNAADQLKQFGGLAKQVAALGDERQLALEQIGQSRDLILQLAAEIDRVEAQTKADRADIARVEEAQTSLERRIEGTGASAFQIGERITAISQRLDDVRGDLRDLTERVDEIGGRLAWSDEDRTRLEGRLSALESQLRLQEREARERVEELAKQFDAAIAIIQARITSRGLIATDQLRHTVALLQEQLLQLEGQTREAALSADPSSNA